MLHPLDHPGVTSAVEAASAHAGRPWRRTGFTDLNDRASHPAALLHGEPFSIFAKAGGDGGQPETELRGLELIRQRTAAATPVPIGAGTVDTGAGCLLVLEAVPEVPAEARSPRHWRSIGHSLALLHQATHDSYGLADFDGFFGPLPQDNRPVPGASWPEFYAERRLLPLLALAAGRGHLPGELAAGVERVIDRLPEVCGPEPVPTLLHGDAQQNNVITTPTGAVLVDPAPYYGHPEVDLALLDYFAPVPAEVFDAYREVAPLDAGFAERRELWRLFAYLAVVAVDAESDFGRPFLGRIADAVALYR